MSASLHLRLPVQLRVLLSGEILQAVPQLDGESFVKMRTEYLGSYFGI